MSRKDSENPLLRNDSKPGTQFAQEVQEAIVENSRAMSPGPRSTSIEEPPSFREPAPKRLFDGMGTGSKARPITSSGATRSKYRNKLFALGQQKNQRVINQMLEQRQGANLMRFQSAKDYIAAGEQHI